MFQIEKSFQRIRKGESKPMYTTEASILKKIGPECVGWKEV